MSCFRVVISEGKSFSWTSPSPLPQGFCHFLEEAGPWLQKKRDTHLHGPSQLLHIIQHGGRHHSHDHPLKVATQFRLQVVYQVLQGKQVALFNCHANLSQPGRSQSVVWDAWGLQTPSGGLQGQSSPHDNTKTLFAFSLSFSPICTVEFCKGYLTYLHFYNSVKRLLKCPFPSTYLYKTRFSSYTSTKTMYHNKWCRSIYENPAVFH